MVTKTLAPVVLVAALWVAVSTATTYYVHWLERSHHQFFDDNIVSIRAAEAMQILVWRLAAECPDDATQLPAFRRRWKEAADQLSFERQRLDQSAFSDAEKQVLEKMDASLNAFRECLDRIVDRSPQFGHRTDPIHDLPAERLRAIELAGGIAAANGEILRINRTIADRDEALRSRIGRNVFLFRLAMMVVGPVVGVLFGWRLAVQLHRSIARISVTLHDAGSSKESDVGTVAIESSSDFHEVQQQAEQVAERMRQVSRDLQIARREVVQAERLAAVGELAAGVAHEIRNPLTSVKLLLQHAIRQSSGPNLDEDKLRLILDEIGRMESTIQGLLDFSRPSTLNRVTHDARQTLRRALNLVDARAREQGIEIVTHIEDDPLMIEGDAEKLHQVLINLLINAIEAMPDGGRLSIDAVHGGSSGLPGSNPAGLHPGAPAAWSAGSWSEGTFVRTSTAQLNDHSPPAEPNWNSASKDHFQEDDPGTVRIIIHDTGEGIPNEVLPRLFEPFATSKERGTGLGLAVSRRIVEEHHGTLHACNDPEGGAEFTLELPAVSIPVPALSAPMYPG